MSVEVTSIGDVNLDLITSKIKSLPDRDSQTLVEEIGLSSGGCAANFAKAVCGLGMRARLIGKLGSDLLGSFVRKDLADVDLRLSSGKTTGVTVGITFEDDTRSFLSYTGSNSDLVFEDIDFGLIEGRCLHVASFFLQGLREKTAELLSFAHKKGMLTSFDVGWDPSGWSEDDKRLVCEVLEGADVFFPNVREAEAITGEKEVKRMCEVLHGMGPSIVALKLGKQGSMIFSDEGFFDVPPFEVEAIDTTGAGDVFAAGFVFGRLRGLGLEDAGRFASAAAALSTRGFGSRRYPTEEEVKTLL